ncbi:MAG: VCBS repeat-containing protein [Pseudomonadota bacterium]
MRLALHLSIAGLGLLACNSDYDLNRPKDDDNQNPDDTGEYDSGDPPDDTATPGECVQTSLPGEDIGVGDECTEPPEGGFTPIVEWHGGAGLGCLSQPLVADMNGDGLPEIIVNFLTSFAGGDGRLVVLKGDGSGTLWQDSSANLAYGSPPALGDVDGDGRPEVVVVREYASALFAAGDYTAAMYDDNGTVLWESEHFIGLDFDWGTAPIISDMDHDGHYEVVVGRVILNADDGSTRGVGAYGRGCYGLVTIGTMNVSESSVPAVTDLDLDGVEEVIVGNAAYDPDGNALRHDASQEDAMIGIANLDDDPEGEIVAVTYNTVRAQDTDGSTLWGPVEIASANILSTPAIGDLDLDGRPEIVVAGGNRLLCLNHDGTTLWSAAVHDESGATGASIFDFEGDGKPDVVYIDEVEMVAYEGATGAVKFYSTEHASNTMFDYPTIADVDGDDQAEIVVCHNGYGYGLSVYGDQDESWVPARKVWNQHAYDIDNVNDDGTVPQNRTYGFTTHNTWHSAIATDGSSLTQDLEAEITDVCLDDCDLGRVWAAVRMRNVGLEATEEDLSLALYSSCGGSHDLLSTVTVPAGLASGRSSDAAWVLLDAADLGCADALWLAADDDGTSSGRVRECSETNNGFQYNGPFCE